MITPGALLDPPKLQLFTDDGEPAAGYYLYTYEAGTSTPLDTYSDQDLTSPNTNPIVLDDAGRSVVYLQPGVGYKFVLRTSAGDLIWTQDYFSDLATLLFGYLVSTEGSKGVTDGYVITDDDIFVTVNSAAVNPTEVVLPAALDRYKPIFIKNIGPNPVSVVADGADTIEDALTSIGIPGATSPLFPTIRLQSDMVSNYWVFNGLGGVTSGGGGGGGSAMLLQTTTVLDNDDIKNLPSTPVTLVPAPGAGYRIVPVVLTVHGNTTSGAYTGIDATYAAMEFVYDGLSNWIFDAIADDSSVVMTYLTGLLGGVNNTTRTILAGLSAVEAAGAAGALQYITAQASDGSTAANKALTVKIDNDGNPADLGGGHANNTVTIVVTYMLEPMS